MIRTQLDERQCGGFDVDLLHETQDSTKPSKAGEQYERTPAVPPRKRTWSIYRQLQRTRVKHIMTKLSMGESSVGAKAEGGSEAQPR